jgi:hypothetical protein
MVATVTYEMKRRFIDEFRNDADSASVNYYIGISRSEDWNATDTAPTPVNTEREQRLFRYGLQSVKKVADYSFVVPRKNWTAGAKYFAYNDATEEHVQDFYVVNASNQVYVCIQHNITDLGVHTTSTVEPSGVLTRGVVLSDGYGWRFLYTIGTLAASFFKSQNFIPVKFQGPTDGSSSATDIEQLAKQNAAISGLTTTVPKAGKQIVGFNIVAGGAGYSSEPTVVITGDGHIGGTGGVKADAIISDGAVVNIKLLADSAGGENCLRMGQGFDFAAVTLTGGSPTTAATANVVFGPEGGFGADPRDDLRARAMMFNAKPVGNEEGEFQVGNSFRQIGLLRDPTTPAGALFTASDGNCLRRLQMASTDTAFSQGATLLGGTSGAVALVDSADTLNGGEIWFHQNEDTGFTQFAENEAISVTTGQGAGTTQATGTDGDTLAFVEPKVDKFSGQLLYIENAAAVIRAADQTEDIKVIVEI